jgi:hypothetical protein
VGKAEDCLVELRQLLVKHLSLTHGPHASLTQNISFHLLCSSLTSHLLQSFYLTRDAEARRASNRRAGLGEAPELDGLV